MLVTTKLLQSAHDIIDRGVGLENQWHNSHNTSSKGPWLARTPPPAATRWLVAVRLGEVGKSGAKKGVLIIEFYLQLYTQLTRGRHACDHSRA